MTYLRAEDTLSGTQGTATASIDGLVQDLFFLKTFEATLTKKKVALNVLGRRGEQHKAAGWSGKGSLNMYYITSIFRNLASVYNLTGKDTYFNITVTNEDANSTVGTQTLTLYNCNMDSAVLAKLDVGSEALDEDADFTFDDFIVLNAFGQPVAL